ncbi:hypothetical protein ACLOJK_028403 [Asimina triloba]
MTVLDALTDMGGKAGVTNLYGLQVVAQVIQVEVKVKIVQLMVEETEVELSHTPPSILTYLHEDMCWLAAEIGSLLGQALVRETPAVEERIEQRDEEMSILDIVQPKEIDQVHEPMGPVG